MTRLLRACVLFSVPVLYAAEHANMDFRTIKIGAQAQVHMLDIGWGIDAKSSRTQDDNIVALLNSSSHNITKEGDRSLDYGLGAALTVRADIAEEFRIMLRLGVESNLEDAVGLKVDKDNNLSVVTPAGIWSSKSVFSPAGFVGYKGLYVGFVYDMREYDTPLHGEGVTVFSKTLTDNQLLLGFRGETEYFFNNMGFTVGIEVMNNVGAKAGDNARDYYAEMMNQLGMYDDINPGGLAQRALYADVTKLSFTLGVLFEDL